MHKRRSIATKPPKELRYRRPYLNNVEDVEKYRSGGYHPIHLGDVLKGGRYLVLHKSGHGGFSTVWLARDQYQDKLVSLKVLTAEASRNPTELKLLRYLDEHAHGNPCRSSIIATLDDFTINGPNGMHLCYVSQPGDPSLSAISDSPGEVAGTRRLRASLARTLSRQLVEAVSFMHSIDVVHGGTLMVLNREAALIARIDITPKNVLLRLKGIDAWPTETIYQQVGRPVRDKVLKSSGQKPDISAPEYLVEPSSLSCVDSEYISEQVLLIDLGEAFLEESPPPNGVGTPVSYCSPELILESKAGKVSDIWALACTIFEIRAGFPLFESFVGSSDEILEEIVRILGMPPKTFHSLRKKIGITITGHAHLDGSTLSDRIREIGMYDEESSDGDSDVASVNQHPLLEPSGRRVARDEAIDLSDMLQKMLDYTPENRLSAEEVAKHPWLHPS
ncbi:hypothetical protein LTR50_007636 [Elasticomyces elasticus]|nr:hypothetical protein LTR50_007636 [Elasticomyces elasticus]